MKCEPLAYPIAYVAPPRLSKLVLPQLKWVIPHRPGVATRRGRKLQLPGEALEGLIAGYKFSCCSLGP